MRSDMQKVIDQIHHMMESRKAGIANPNWDKQDRQWAQAGYETLQTLLDYINTLAKE